MPIPAVTPPVNRRRALQSFAAIGLDAVAMPDVVRAQAAEPVRRIGWLGSAMSGVRPTFADGLRELGWDAGKNLAFVVREGPRDRVGLLARELVAARADLIVAVAPSAIRAAMAATSEVPIVMAWWGGPDLVASGIIASYAKPGGNVTGVDMLLSALDAKRLDMLRQALPRSTKIAVLIQGQRVFEPQLLQVRETARRLDVALEIVDIGETSTDYDAAFEAIARSQAQALLVMGNPQFGRDRRLIIERAARWRVPAIYAAAIDAREGGLLSYGTTAQELDRQVARQVDRILRGARPGDLPVERPTKFELAVNLATAKALGLTLPRSVLVQADQVIE